METNLGEIQINEREKVNLLDLLIATTYYISEKGKKGNPFVKSLGNKDEEEAYRIMTVAVSELSPVMQRVLQFLTEAENEENSSEQPLTEQ